ncbi:MAG: hypothetical protein ACPGSM_21390 [Thiolinea sp.]
MKELRLGSSVYVRIGKEKPKTKPESHQSMQLVDKNGKVIKQWGVIPK